MILTLMRDRETKICLMARDNSGGGVNSSKWGVAAAPPSVAPMMSNGIDREEHWRSFDSTVNAVSFGFVATAILISMFLIMAIFERFLRARSTDVGGRSPSDIEAQLRVHGKLDYPSPKGMALICHIQGKMCNIYYSCLVLLVLSAFTLTVKMTVYARGVSVLMPGEEIPTFIAHPAPAPSPPDCIAQPLHQHDTKPTRSSISPPIRSAN